MFRLCHSRRVTTWKESSFTYMFKSSWKFFKEKKNAKENSFLFEGKKKKHVRNVCAKIMPCCISKDGFNKFHRLIDLCFMSKSHRCQRKKRTSRTETRAMFATSLPASVSNFRFQKWWGEVQFYVLSFFSKREVIISWPQESTPVKPSRKTFNQSGEQTVQSTRTSKRL